MSDLIYKQSVVNEIDGGFGVKENSKRTAQRIIGTVPSADATPYTEWLEEKLLECQPQILCDVVNTSDSDWCEDNCENMRPECLRKCYEICKGGKP